jgi:hypothetical protein
MLDNPVFGIRALVELLAIDGTPDNRKEVGHVDAEVERCDQVQANGKYGGLTKIEVKVAVRVVKVTGERSDQINTIKKLAETYRGRTVDHRRRWWLELRWSGEMWSRGVCGIYRTHTKIEMMVAVRVMKATGEQCGQVKAYRISRRLTAIERLDTGDGGSQS